MWDKSEASNKKRTVKRVLYRRARGKKKDSNQTGLLTKSSLKLLDGEIDFVHSTIKEIKVT